VLSQSHRSVNDAEEVPLIQEAQQFGRQERMAMAKKPDIRFIDYLQQKYALSDVQREMLHRAITKQGLSKQEIEELAAWIKHNYPRQ
jgi:hypothetical protein